MIKMGREVLLIDTVLAHYREDLFKHLEESYKYNFEIIAGNSFIGIKSLNIDNSKLSSYITLKVFGHRFYYLKGVVKYIISKKSPIICTGVDFHLVHTLIIYFIHKTILGRKFYWWSHAGLGKQGKLGYLIRKFFYTRSTGILVYSDDGRDNLLQMGVKKENIEVVRNALNYADYGFLNYKDLDKKNRIFTILFSGRITKAKKVHKLISALSVIKKKDNFKFKCIIIGDGEIEELKILSNKLGVYNEIDFVGAKYGEEVHSYFRNADLFVYPGGIGLSLLHALSFGIPVITTNNLAQQFPEFELLKKGINGDLYNDDSIEDLADKIIEWKNKLDESKKTYADNCIDTIRNLEYLPDKMCKHFFNLLDRTL